MVTKKKNNLKNKITRFIKAHKVGTFFTIVNIFISIGAIIGNRIVNDYYTYRIQTNIFKEAKSSQEVSAPQAPQVAGLDTCVYVVCEDFSNFDNWEELSRFERISEKILKYSTSDVGSIMTQKDQIFLPATLIYEFIPQGDQANILIRYADFDIIIGDAGYSRIAVKDINGYVKPEGYKVGHFTLPQEIQKGRSVKARVGLSAIKNTDRVKIEIWLTYFNRNGAFIEEFQAPDFIAISSVNPTQIKSQITLGFLPPSTKELTVSAELISLTVAEGLQ